MDSKHKYLIYGRRSCPFCVEAVEVLQARDIENIFFDLESDQKFLNEAKQFYNHPTVPIVLKIDNDSGIVKLIGGCDNLKGDISD